MQSCNACDAVDDDLNLAGYCFPCQIEIAKANPDVAYMCVFCTMPSNEPHVEGCRMALAVRYYNGKTTPDDEDFKECEASYDAIMAAGLDIGGLKVSMRPQPGKTLTPDLAKERGAMALVTMRTRELDGHACEGCGSYCGGGTARGVILQENDNIDANWLIWVLPNGFSVSDESANGPIAACSSCQASPVIKTLRFDGERIPVLALDEAQ